MCPWAHAGGYGAMASPVWLCNKVLKPNFQSIISQTNNGCSLLSLISAKYLLLGISSQNIFTLSIVTALAACLGPFFFIYKNLFLALFLQNFDFILT